MGRNIFRFTASIAIALSLFCIPNLANASTAALTPQESACPPNSPGIVSNGASLYRLDTGHRKFATGKWHFIVFCPPLEGELDLRLQVKTHNGEWATRSRSVRNVSNNTEPGQTFTMHVSADCGGDQSWRLRLFVAPGYSGNGDPYGPHRFYYPKEAGKQLDCK